MRLAAPAKLNFGLRIRGRRSDGLHELESVFLPLPELADELELELAAAERAEVALELAGEAAGVPQGDANLASRAARAFLGAAGLRRAVRLRLRKAIPAAAGLGGGSSDAGAVLRGLAAELPGVLSDEALERLALELGADVPFFLDPRPALVGGAGERRTPLAPGWPSFALLLAHPGRPLATRRVFEAFDAASPLRAADGPPLEALVEAARQRRLGRERLQALLRNDLEPVAAALCPPLARLAAALRDAGAQAVGMSGSGPTLFGVFESESRARAARRELPPTLWARVAATPESG